MNKLYLFLIILILPFSLIGCKKEPDKENTPDNPIVTEQEKDFIYKHIPEDDELTFLCKKKLEDNLDLNIDSIELLYEEFTIGKSSYNVYFRVNEKYYFKLRLVETTIEKENVFVNYWKFDCIKEIDSDKFE